MYFREARFEKIFLFPQKTKIILSKLEVNNKLLWYFIWSKYFKQNTEITKIISGGKKWNWYTVSKFFQRLITLQLIQGTVSHRQNINCFALNWLKVFKNCFATARQAAIWQNTPVFSWSMNHIYVNFSKPSLSTEKMNISIGIFSIDENTQLRCLQKLKALYSALETL